MVIVNKNILKRVSIYRYLQHTMLYTILLIIKANIKLDSQQTQCLRKISVKEFQRFCSGV